MQAVGSPFAHHGPGDHRWPVDQSVTLCYPGTPLSEVAVDADPAIRAAMPGLPDLQHPLNRAFLGLESPLANVHSPETTDRNRYVAK